MLANFFFDKVEIRALQLWVVKKELVPEKYLLRRPQHCIWGYNFEPHCISSTYAAKWAWIEFTNISLSFQNRQNYSPSQSTKSVSFASKFKWDVF